jgi:hypothetical protein
MYTQVLLYDTITATHITTPAHVLSGAWRFAQLRRSSPHDTHTRARCCVVLRKSYIATRALVLQRKGTAGSGSTQEDTFFFKKKLMMKLFKRKKKANRGPRLVLAMLRRLIKASSIGVTASHYRTKKKSSEAALSCTSPPAAVTIDKAWSPICFFFLQGCGKRKQRTYPSAAAHKHCSTGIILCNSVTRKLDENMCHSRPRAVICATAGQEHACK